MIVSVHQPQFLPWLGYFDKMIQSDVFCYLDNVQYKKNEWQNRNRIKTKNDWQWLTVPVQYRFPQKINEVKINKKVKWERKHLQSLITNYKKSRFFDEYFGIFQDAYSNDWERLSDFNIHLIERIRVIFKLNKKPAVRASALNLSEDPTDRLIDICQELGCDAYFSGESGVDYMDLQKFKKKKINIRFQKFKHPKYPQLFGEFRSHMSIIDLLFNCGPESIQIMRGQS